MTTIKRLFARVLALLGHALTFLFGRISWQVPGWLRSSGQLLLRSCKARPRLWAGSALVLALLAGGYYWYQHLPKPIQTVANITAPDITPIDEEGQLQSPQSLTIKFSRGGDEAVSVAPLSAVGKPVTTGISLSPALPGAWQWESDSELKFVPTQDWPAGQTYQVTFDKKLFANTVKLDKYRYSFSTADFAVSITDMKFSQDLTNPRQTEIVATLNFNFPVDSKSLEQHIHLVLQALKNDKLDLKAKPYQIKLTYDASKRTAYLHSENVPLSTAPRYIELVIDKGVMANTGAKTMDDVSDKVLVPDEGSFLQITQADTTIVRDKRDRPQQILNLTTSLGVTNKELQHIHVYRLPNDRPATGAESAEKNYDWSSTEEVTDKVLAQATPVTLTALPEEHEFPTLHSWQFEATAPGFLYVKVDKGVRGFGNFLLSDNYQTIVKVPELPKEINFLHQGALISLSGEKKLTVLVRGVPQVRFSISRVLPNEFNHLISQTRGDFQSPRFINDMFTKEDLSELFIEKRDFQMNSPSDLQYTTLDLQQYLKKAGQESPLGLFLIQAQAWDPKTNLLIKDTVSPDNANDSDDTNTDESASDTETKTVENSRLILITDMGLLVKNNADKTHDVFVQSISQGTPVSGAEVSLLGRNGLPIVSGTTQADGHVQLPSVTNFSDERDPTVYVVRKGDDISFMPYNRYDRQLNFSRFNVDGVVNYDNNTLTAFLFSERGIYRPGDNIHLGMVVKQQFATALPAGLPVELVIKDSRYTTVLDQKLSLSDSGLMSLDYQTDSTSPTGTYTAELYLVKDGKKDSLLGDTRVRVEEFLPDRLRARAAFVKGVDGAPVQSPGWVSPNDLNARLQVNNLYGTPAANRRVTAKMVLAPRELSFSQYAAYTFVDPLLNPDDPPKVLNEDLSDGTTDTQGNVQFALNLQRFAKAAYRLTFLVEAFEADGGRGVSTQVSTLVTPLDYLIGYKPDSDLKYLKQNSQHAVNFIAINPVLQKTAAADLQAELLSIQTVATLIKNKDGTYAYQSVKHEKSLWQKPFALTDKGDDFTLPTQDIGDYALIIKNKAGDAVSRVNFSVVGPSGHPVQKEAELAVKLDKTSYNAGDTIEMQITAPYRGAGLITLERDKVYAYQWFKADDTNSVQTIKIPADFKGNGYVNVAFVRDWDSDEIFISPLSYSVIPFSVSNAASTVQIKLNSPSLVKPGQAVPIEYSTNVPAKIVIFAVDQGILQVTDYKLPDPLAYFFRKYALGVDTAQIVDQILPKYIASREASAVGGDDGDQALASNINPFKRKTEAPVVYWSGILDSDNIVRTTTYSVPDYFNGNLRIMAVAVADNAVGNAQKDSLVRGDFVISPNTPNVVAPGDKFIVTANIANNIKDADKATPTIVSLETKDGLKILGTAEQNVVIPSGEERSVEFNIEAQPVLGSASLLFRAKQGMHEAHYQATLSIRPTGAYQTTLVSGSDDSHNKKIPIARHLYAEHRIQQALASTNPLILVHGLQGYLQTYPYNCTEQLVSAAFAQLAVAKQPLFATDADQTQQQLDKILQMLSQRQNNNDGFSYWPGQDDNAASQFATVYAMDFLTEAKMQGYAVSDSLFSNGLRYLKNLAKADPADSNEARLHAYAIYVLTRNEIVTSSYLTNLQLYLTRQGEDWRQDLTSAYLAATYQLLKDSEEANRLIRGYKLKKDTDSYDSAFTNSLVDNAQYLTLLARHFPERLQRLGNEPIMALIAGVNNNGQVNTLSAAYAVTALNAYAQTSADNSAGLTISEILADSKARLLPSLNSRYQQAEFSDQAKSIRFDNPDKHLYFYQIRQSGFDSQPLTKAIQSGLEVYREYRNDKGEVVNQTQLGNEVESHIQIRALDDNSYSNVAIVDLIPGGFDVIPASVEKGDCDYADVREDRVIFYCPISATAKELKYHLRAVNKGDYIAPSVLAQDMYRQGVQSVGAVGKIAVK